MNAFRSSDLNFYRALIFCLIVGSAWGCSKSSNQTQGPSTSPSTQNNPTQVEANQVARPFPQHISYTAGSLKISHRTQAQQDDDVRAAYDRWKANYLAAAKPNAQGSPRYRVKMHEPDNATDATSSESQGYGLMIVALMAGYDPDARKIVDGLWRFTSDHRSEIDKRLPDWWVNADESPDNNGNTSAFDGEADIAYGLLLADAQWGSQGEINYRGEALSLLQAMMEKEIGPQSRLPMIGDFVDPNNVVGITQYTTRTSDFMYGHFRVFAKASGNKVWLEAIAACQAATTLIQTKYAPKTGLLPDFLARTSDADTTLRPALPKEAEGEPDGQYAANAGRVPWRIGTDWLLNGNMTSRQEVQKISTWAMGTTGGDPLKIKPGYNLDGTPLPPADYFSTFYVAPMGVAAMVTPDQQTWLNAIYDAVRNEVQGYYEDSVSLLSILVMTGNFWDPTQNG